MAFFGFQKSSPAPPLLVPQLKPGKNAQHSDPPGAFDTKQGRLLVPRLADPPAPTPEMISNARQEKLTSFFRDGKIHPAHDFIEDVSLRTAKISLDETYDFQTRQLDDWTPLPGSIGRTLRTLRYIALKEDELPSFHYWTWVDFEDPVANSEPTDWDEVLKKQSKPAGQEECKQGDDEQDRRPIGDNVSGEPTGEKEKAMKPHKTRLSSSKEQYGVTQGRKDRYEWLDPIEKTPNVKITTTPKAFSNQPAASPDYIPGLNVNVQGNSPVSQSGAASKKEADKSTEDRLTSMLTPEDTAPPSTQSPELTNVVPRKALLRCERGGMYLNDLTTPSFKEMALYLVQSEEDETTVGSGQRFIDVIQPGESESKAHLIAAGRPLAQMYRRYVEHFLGKKGYHFRIRSDAYHQSSSWDLGRKGTLKVTRVDVGYCYVNASGSWSGSKAPSQRGINSDRFKSALDFLFGRDEKETKELTLEIPPEHGSHDIDRSSAMPLSRGLEEIFEELTNRDPYTSGTLVRVPFCYSAEIFVHEQGTEFKHPLTATLESLREEEEEAKKERLLEQQKAQKKTNTTDSTAQQSVRRWSTTVPTTVFDFNPGPIASSVGSRVRSASEVEDLERRLQTAEQKLQQQSATDQLKALQQEGDELRYKVDQQEKQVTTMSNEYDELGTKAKAEANDLEQQRHQLRTQQRELEREVQELTAEREGLQNQVNDLESQAIETREEYEESRLTIEDLETQLQKMTDERDQLQSRVNEHSQETAEPDQGPNQNQSQDYNDTDQRPAGGATDPIATAAADPSQENAEASAPNPPSGSADPTKLLYCTVCMKSVDKLTPKVGQKTLKQDSRLT